MKGKDALKKLENQLALLNALGKWTGSEIVKRLNKDKLDIGYTAMFVDEKHPAKVISSGILILRDLPEGPGPQPNCPVAIIKTDPETCGMPIMPVMEIPSRAKTYLSPEEYQRFLKVMNLIADEMSVPLIEEQ